MKNLLVILIIPILTAFEFSNPDETELKKTTVSAEGLLNWTVVGKGKVEKSGTQIAMQESDDSKGIMLVSPNKFGSDIIVKYKVLALTPATVLVALVSVTDDGSTNLTIPEDHDGSLGFWLREKNNYFFAFKNAPHNVTPFVRKSPTGEELGSAFINKMIAGVYYDVEVGNCGGKLWLKVDGVKLFETNDPEPLDGGHLALRIRGTAGFKAACLIKDLEIYSAV